MNLHVERLSEDARNRLCAGSAPDGITHIVLAAVSGTKNVPITSLNLGEGYTEEQTFAAFEEVGNAVRSNEAGVHDVELCQLARLHTLLLVRCSDKALLAKLPVEEVVVLSQGQSSPAVTPSNSPEKSVAKQSSDSTDQESVQPESEARSEHVCYICLGDSSEQELQRGCACRGESGFVHVACLVEYATSYQQKEETTCVGTGIHPAKSPWFTCVNCKQMYTGQLQLAMARANWEKAQELPPLDQMRLFAADRLASALQMVEKNYEAALPLFKESLEGNARTLGWTDDNTECCMHNLAVLYSEMGDFQASAQLNEKVLASRRKKHGNLHPFTQDSMRSLTQDYKHMGRLKEALKLSTEALEASQSRGDTVDTFVAMSECGTQQFFNKQFAVGLDKVEKAYQGLQQLLGSAHPHTKTAASRLDALRKFGVERSAYDIGRIAGTLVGLQQRPELNGTEVEVLGHLGEDHGGRIVCRVVERGYSPSAQEYVQWLCKHGTTAGGSRSLNVSFGNLLLNRGVKLLVQGLKAAPELNGTKATISGFDDERGRYIVKIEGQGRAKALKPENCGLAFQPSLHSFPKN